MGERLQSGLSGTVQEQARGNGGQSDLPVRVRTQAGRSAVLSELEERFARFRAQHRRGTRVPGELRAATLAALREGVTAGELYWSCGVSRTQIAAWGSGGKWLRTSSRTYEAAPADVRVFSVVDTEPVDPPGAVDRSEAEIELRLGQWSVRVRRVDRVRGG